MKVLVIDEDEDIRNITRHMLTAEGHEVTTCSRLSPRELPLQWADIILLDEWSGHKRDGISLSSGIKNLMGAASKPIIVFSTDDDTEALAQYARADGYLQKPFDLDELIRIIDNTAIPQKIN
ncbi:response regulator [Mucilaginibacter sp. 14171R-50]|uniref:response regulator n=1 Tax=Mucilaginibacter sp. 14171R-50 TaxID=2703789 RepID=UPI00138CF7B8|nr:response regulator [Mucilaginibacter sp. 14171R-50]QHS55963.1 response regulator [Mucilaginibacter sp. 14171R-50]